MEIIILTSQQYTHSFIHSLKIFLLDTYPLTVTVVGAEDAMKSKYQLS